MTATEIIKQLCILYREPFYVEQRDNETGEILGELPNPIAIIAMQWIEENIKPKIMDSCLCL